MSSLNATERELASSIVLAVMESGLSYEEAIKVIAHTLVTGASASGMNDVTYEVEGSGRVILEL